jgi:hypothetical protein
MAMCLRCMQEGKYVDAETCGHAEPAFTTHKKKADKPANKKENK